MKVTDLPRGTEVKPQSDRKSLFLSLSCSRDEASTARSIHATQSHGFLFVAESGILRVTCTDATAWLHPPARQGPW